jgi:septum formation protein
MKFILASKSPRRIQILKKAKFKFKIIPSEIDESVISTNLKPEDYCMELAKLKSKYISKKYTDYTVIGADTIVFINGKILNKPLNMIEAKNMLNLLSGNKHKVLTGVSLQNQILNINFTFFDVSEVKFYPINNLEIDNYISNCNPLDKAGSYGIQDESAIFIEKIHGSYDNIMGFPISKFYQSLKLI